jgi:hypothetical protein
MADTTPSYSFSLPTVGGDSDAWGGFLNQNWSSLDDLLNGTTALTSVKIITGDGDFDTLSARDGTLNGMTIEASAVAATNLSAAGYIQEGVQTISGTTPVLNPTDDGTLITWTLTSGVQHAPVVVLDNGQNCTLLVNSGTGTIAWSGIEWINGTPPLEANKVNFYEFFKVGTITYGAGVGFVP